MPSETGQGHPVKSDRFALFGIFGGCVFFTITGLANPFFSLYAAELGATTFAIGAMVTLKALLPIFIAMPAGQLIDSLGPVRMLQWGSWLLLTALACMVFAEGLALLALSQVFSGRLHRHHGVGLSGAGREGQP
jgi:predicted MFS family arabinose efflux permease